MLEATLRPYATTTFHFEKRSWDGAAHGFERLSGWLGSIFSLLALPEVVWACTRKQSDGFTKPTPGIITLVAMAAGFGLLSIAMNALPPGTEYAVWTGIGALGALMVGVRLLGEEPSSLRPASAAAILLGIAG